ncbi:MAG: hypothetical protein IPK12_16365 [Gemmatimonadetes bacterium]|nr:hypothetical protein [Gemmatimonadota bacterium]
MRGPLSARPSLTLVLLATPGHPGLEQCIADLVPTCGGYGADLLVAGAKSLPGSWAEGAVRFLPSGPGETPHDLRARALAESAGDIVLFLTVAQAQAEDVAGLLGHRAGIVSVDGPEAGAAVAPAEQSSVG